MKTDDKSGTADTKGCMVTGAKSGSTEAGTRIMPKTVTRANEHDGKHRSKKKATVSRKGISAKIHGR